MEHPVEVLLDEHRLIERMLAEVETRVLNSGGKLPLDFVETALDFFAGFADGSHHHKEERVLFPMIRELDQATSAPQFHCGSLQNPISVMMREHDMVGDLLAALHRLTDGFQTPADGCASSDFRR